jgi:hypothetical protein
VVVASCGNKYYGSNFISAVPTSLLIAPGLRTIQFLFTLDLFVSLSKQIKSSNHPGFFLFYFRQGAGDLLSTFGPMAIKYLPTLMSMANGAGGGAGGEGGKTIKRHLINFFL